MVLPSKCATKKRMLVYLADLVVNFSWFLAKLNLGNTRFVSWFCFEKCATLRLLVSVKVHSYCYSNRFLGKELTIWKIGRVWKYTRQNYKTCIFQLQHWEKGEKKRSWHKTIFSNFNGRNLKKNFTYFNCCSFFNSSGLRAKKSGGNATVLLTWLGSKTLGLRSSSARIGSAPTKASLN